MSENRLWEAQRGFLSTRASRRSRAFQRRLRQGLPRQPRGSPRALPPWPQNTEASALVCGAPRADRDLPAAEEAPPQPPKGLGTSAGRARRQLRRPSELPPRRRPQPGRGLPLAGSVQPAPSAPPPARRPPHAPHHRTPARLRGRAEAGGGVADAPVAWSAPGEHACAVGRKSACPFSSPASAGPARGWEGPEGRGGGVGGGEGRARAPGRRLRSGRDPGT